MLQNMHYFEQGFITAQVTDGEAPAYLITTPNDTYICRDQSVTSFKLGDHVGFRSYPTESPADFPHIHEGAADLRKEPPAFPDVEGVVGEDGRVGIICTIRNYDSKNDTWKTDFFSTRIAIETTFSYKNAFIDTRVLLKDERNTGVWKFVEIVAPPDSLRWMNGFVFAEDLREKQMSVFVPGMPSYFYFPLKSRINVGLGRWISFPINEHAIHNDHYDFLGKDVFQTTAPSTILKETQFKICLKCSKKSEDVHLWTSTGDTVSDPYNVLKNNFSDHFQDVDLWISFRTVRASMVNLYVSKHQPHLASSFSSTDSSEKSGQERDTTFDSSFSTQAPLVDNIRPTQPDLCRKNWSNSYQERDFPVQTRWVHRGNKNSKFFSTPLTPSESRNSSPRDAHRTDHGYHHQQKSTTSPNDAPNSSPPRSNPPRYLNRSPPRNGYDSGQDEPIKKPQRINSDQMSSNMPTFNLSPRHGRYPDHRSDNQKESKRSQSRLSQSPPRNSRIIPENIIKPPRLIKEIDSSSNKSSSPGNSTNNDAEVMKLKSQIDEMKVLLKNHIKYKHVFDMMKRVLVDYRFHNVVRSYNADLAMDLQRAVNG